MIASAKSLECIVTPLPPSEDVTPFAARLKRGYRLRFIVVSFALCACTATLVFLIFRAAHDARLASLLSFQFVSVCLVLISLEMDVLVALALNVDLGEMATKLPIRTAWCGTMTVRQLSRTLLAIYAAIAVLVLLVSSGLLSLLFTSFYRYSLTLPGIAHTHVESVRL